MHCLRIGKKSLPFVLRPLNSMLNSEVDRLSLQRVEYEMDYTDYPVDYNLKKRILKLEQATNLMITNL